ncbi:hypothetical protein [Polymorphobacter megasporae]|uniref:hypothetical protein n=1 Tax=Glacieibacterium megasporae TaxID=2835787 RepID=UPI001CAA5FE6|nr:hypothetical protein [Polymorphobacter megasporae]UAJ12356.1 hypothetical protein KTC28_21305 [Polymorphobacter megasporae]
MGPYILFGSLMGDRLVRPYAASRTVAGFIASNQPGTAREWHMRAYHLMSPSQLDMDAAWIAGDNNELIDANGLSRTIDKVAAPAILYVFMISTEWYRIHPAKAAAGSAVFHELDAAVVKEIAEVVEASGRERGDGLGCFVEAIDDAEAAIFGFHLLGKLLDDLDIDAKAACRELCGEHH